MQHTKVVVVKVDVVLGTWLVNMKGYKTIDMVMVWVKAAVTSISTKNPDISLYVFIV